LLQQGLLEQSTDLNLETQKYIQSYRSQTLKYVVYRKTPLTSLIILLYASAEVGLYKGASSSTLRGARDCLAKDNCGCLPTSNILWFRSP